MMNPDFDPLQMLKDLADQQLLMSKAINSLITQNNHLNQRIHNMEQAYILASRHQANEQTDNNAT